MIFEQPPKKFWNVCAFARVQGEYQYTAFEFSADLAEPTILTLPLRHLYPPDKYMMLEDEGYQRLFWEMRRGFPYVKSVGTIMRDDTLKALPYCDLRPLVALADDRSLQFALPEGHHRFGPLAFVSGTYKTEPELPFTDTMANLNDGGVQLYAQADDPKPPWDKSSYQIELLANVSKTNGVVIPDEHVWRREVSQDDLTDAFQVVH